MTATVSSASRRDVLSARLASLRAEREPALAETIPSGNGDVADRATNVDGHVRLAMLDQRIATVERELAATGEQNARPNGDGATLGDVVTLNFGDGPEAFLLGSVDEAVDGLDVITPNSPLGRALQARAPARPSPTRRARTAPSGQPLSPSAERAPQVGIRAADAVTSARSGSSDSRKTRSWRPLSVDSA